MVKYLPVVLVLIVLVMGVSYYHESKVMTQEGLVQDKVESVLSAPLPFKFSE